MLFWIGALALGGFILTLTQARMGAWTGGGSWPRRSDAG